MKKILNILDPTTLPIAISSSPLIVALIEVNNSGNEVPIGTIVRPIILSEIPNIFK